MGWDSSVCIATRCGLDGPGIESRGGRDFPDRPWGLPSLLYNGYRVIPGDPAAAMWRWSPTLSGAEVKERAELYLYSPYGPSWPVLGWTSLIPHIKFYLNVYILLFVAHETWMVGHCFKLTFMLPWVVTDFVLNNQPDALIIQIYSVIKLNIFRATSLPIIRSFSAIHSALVSFRQVLMTVSSRLCLEPVIKTCMKVTSAECTVEKTPDDGQRSCPKHV